MCIGIRRRSDLVMKMASNAKQICKLLPKGPPKTPYWYNQITRSDQ